MLQKEQKIFANENCSNFFCIFHCVTYCGLVWISYGVWWQNVEWLDISRGHTPIVFVLVFNEYQEQGKQESLVWLRQRPMIKKNFSSS